MPEKAKTIEEIKAEIAKITKDYDHVLTCQGATVFENSPRALMQLEAKCKLETLYWAIGGKRPRFEADKFAGRK